MDRIEKQIILPKGARTLAEYARYYGVDDKGRVAGTYLTIDPPPDPSWTCEDIVLNEEEVESRPVPCPPDVEDPIRNLKAGQRRWVGDADNRPFRADGGCSQVNVLFDPGTGKVLHAFCNGTA